MSDVRFLLSGNAVLLNNKAQSSFNKLYNNIVYSEKKSLVTIW